MNTKQKAYWLVEAILFTGFLAAFFLSFTGVELHQWIGIFGGLLTLYHLISHWDWVNAVNQRFFGRATWTVGFKFTLDSGLLVGFVLVVATGLVISTWLDLMLNNYANLLHIHIMVSIFTLLALLVKLGLHWRWIAKTTRETLSKAITPSCRSVILQPVRVRTQGMERRDFLRVMAVVGGGSLLALLRAIRSLAYLQSVESTYTTQIGTNNTASSFYSTSSLPESALNYSSGSGSCNFQYGRRCSYPGNCRRYTDSDNDKYCDFGECS